MKTEFIYCGHCKKCNKLFDEEAAYKQIDDESWGDGITKEGVCRSCTSKVNQKDG